MKKKYGPIAYNGATFRKYPYDEASKKYLSIVCKKLGLKLSDIYKPFEYQRMKLVDEIFKNIAVNDVCVEKSDLNEGIDAFLIPGFNWLSNISKPGDSYGSIDLRIVSCESDRDGEPLYALILGSTAFLYIGGFAKKIFDNYMCLWIDNKGALKANYEMLAMINSN